MWDARRPSLHRNLCAKHLVGYLTRSLLAKLDIFNFYLPRNSCQNQPAKRPNRISRSVSHAPGCRIRICRRAFSSCALLTVMFRKVLVNDARTQPASSTCADQLQQSPTALKSFGNEKKEGRRERCQQLRDGKRSCQLFTAGACNWVHTHQHQRRNETRSHKIHRCEVRCRVYHHRDDQRPGQTLGQLARSGTKSRFRAL